MSFSSLPTIIQIACVYDSVVQQNFKLTDALTLELSCTQPSSVTVDYTPACMHIGLIYNIESQIGETKQ